MHAGLCHSACPYAGSIALVVIVRIRAMHAGCVQGAAHAKHEQQFRPRQGGGEAQLHARSITRNSAQLRESCACMDGGDGCLLSCKFVVRWTGTCELSKRTRCQLWSGRRMGWTRQSSASRYQSEPSHAVALCQGAWQHLQGIMDLGFCAACHHTQALCPAGAMQAGGPGGLLLGELHWRIQTADCRRH